MEVYILENRKPVKLSLGNPDSLKIWEIFMKTSKRIVKQTKVNRDTRVSTVFLGMDHRWEQGGRPMLFETMIFGGEDDGYQQRYYTWEQAENGHKYIVDCVKTGRTLEDTAE